MEAANCGAFDVGARSAGFNITLPNEQKPNPFITPDLAFRFHYFALRKMHLLMRAKALVAFPGGYGTLDEVFEVLTLVQTGKMPKLPIVLFGKDFWSRAVNFDFLVAEGMITQQDRKLFAFVETAEEAVTVLEGFYQGRRSRYVGSRVSRARKRSGVAMSRKFSIALVLVVLAAFMGYAAWKVLLAPSDLPPEGFARGNGRIEADLVDISTRLAGRVAEISVREGDLVLPGDVLAVMDTTELAAQKMRAEAAVASAMAAVTVAQAGIAQAEASLALSQSKRARAETLHERGIVTTEDLDISRTQAQLDEAGLSAAKAVVLANERAVDAETAALHEIEARIADSTLYAVQEGRVLYRLAQPGEVLGGGGKVLTLVSLGDVYMEFFLPASAAPRVRLGDEARIVVDIMPEVAIPAVVSFVAPQAQFTPKQVETVEERESLMFRIRVRIPHELVAARLTQVKTGVRGVAWVRLVGPDGTVADWPDGLTPPLATVLPAPGDGAASGASQ